MNKPIQKYPSRGRPPVHPLLRKSMPTFRMETWFLRYLEKNFNDPASVIMNCVCAIKGVDRHEMLKGINDVK